MAVAVFQILTQRRDASDIFHCQGLKDSKICDGVQYRWTELVRWGEAKEAAAAQVRKSHDASETYDQ